MPTVLIENIQSLVNVRTENKLLVGEELSHLPCIDNAFLLMQDGQIIQFGRMDEWDSTTHVNEKIDASGRYVLPAWCDSHTHIVFAGSRENEFMDKINGLSYAEIAAKGGGILNSAAKLQATSEDELFAKALERLKEVGKLGTGAIEIKSGYGLTLESELKMLRVIKRLKKAAPQLIKATFLGAHTYPSEFKENHEAYLKCIIEEMLPAIAAEQLADYIDVFCENGFFSPEETIRICEAGKQYGLIPKLHANQLHISGGVQAGVQLGALSLDHLETISDEEIKCLQTSTTISTLLPNPSFFLKMQYAPAKALLAAGLPIALASDYNPGSSHSGNMNLVIALACIQMRLLPAQAINAATINGAYAMGLENEVGSIMIGKKAHIILTKKIPSLAYLPYSFGNNLIDNVLIGNEWMA